jgi:hypothetical protein
VIAIAWETAAVLKKELAPEVPEERAKARPEDPSQLSGQEKGTVKKERVESWLQNSSPVGQIARGIKGNQDGNVRWLRDADLLSRDLPGARILLSNYRTPPDEGKPPSLALVTELRSRLVKVRGDCKNRPIIFIGHDFGVTIIDKTLVECAKDPVLVVDICRVTIGILFFTTPNESTSKGSEDVLYFDAKEMRVGPKGKIKYVEVQNANFLDDHMSKFKNFTDWLSGLRPGMALHSVQSNGKITHGDIDAYRETLNIISELLMIYPLLDAADEVDED